MALKQHNHRMARVTYIIGEVGTNYIKIGVTRSKRSLLKRITDERAGNPRELRVLHTWLFAEDNSAYQLEQAILKQFARQRVRRTEWLCNVTADEVRLWRLNELRGQLMKSSECWNRSETRSEAILQS